MKNTVNFQKFKDDQKNIDKDFNLFSDLTHKFFQLDENCSTNFYKQLYYLIKLLDATVIMINFKKIEFKNNDRKVFSGWLRELADRIEVE